MLAAVPAVQPATALPACMCQLHKSERVMATLDLVLHVQNFPRQLSFPLMVCRRSLACA